MQTLIARVILLFSLIWPFYMAWDIWSDRDLELHGLPVEAYVTGTSMRQSKAGPYLCYDIDYQVEGRDYHHCTARPGLRVGQKVHLLYAPINPSRTRPANIPLSRYWNEGIAHRIIITLIISMIFSLTCLAVLRDLNKKARE